VFSVLPVTLATLLALGVVLYAWGLARVRRARRPFPRLAIAAYALGLLSVAGALFGPLDTLSDGSLSWHMVQHLVLVSVCAPLLLLGAPVRLALAALPATPAASLARALASPPLRILTHPAFAWLQFAFVLYGVHFSPFYEAALENETIHALEHTVFLVSALVFWTPLLAVAPAPHAPSHPVRILALFLALPMSAFLGFAFYVTRHVLYAHYAVVPGALADQQNAGAVMWIAGGAPIFAALLWCVADWGTRERRFETISDGGKG
jgi:putative membrane protein